MAPHADVHVEAVTDTEAITMPDPLSLIAARRTKAGKMIAGTAAPSNPEIFKGIGYHAHKPKAMDWSGGCATVNTTTSMSDSLP